MTFNRYICFCAILESIGAIACMLMALIGNNLLGVIVAAIAALLWIGGEVWGMTAFRRQNPRRDELSDMHQGSAMQFALVSLVGILVIVGFIYTTLNLIDRSIVHIIPPMLLPALAMCALAISDIRYLWLEHDAGTEGDDEDSLKLHRLQRGMKQSDLADLVNVRRETIGRLEQGQYCPSLRLAMDLARVFGTTVEDLFSFDDEYKSESE